MGFRTCVRSLFSSRINRKCSHFKVRLENQLHIILNKIPKNFCEGLDLLIRIQVCSYIRVYRLQEAVLVISLSNLSISIYFSLNEFNNLFSKNNFQDRIQSNRIKELPPQHTQVNPFLIL